MDRSSNASSETLISRIKHKLPLLEFVQRFRQMKPAGDKSGEYSGCCINPAHEDKHPSFYVSTEKNVFSCRGCGQGGNVVDAYALIHGMSKEDAKFALAREIGVLNERRPTKEESFLGKMNEQYQWQLVRKLDAMEYLTRERGLTEETIKRFGIGYCWGSEFKDPNDPVIAKALETGVAKKTDGSKGQIYRSFLAGRVTFPIKDRQGNVVAFAGRTYPKPGLPPSEAPKYLNTPEWAQFKKAEMFYGLSEAAAGIAKTRTAIVVEGYLDVAMSHQAGTTNAIAAMGASASEQAFGQLWSMADRVVFCLDGDKAGHEGSIRSLNAAAATLTDGKEVRIATLPDGVDPDKFVMEHGQEAFERLCLVESKTLTQYLLADLSKSFKMDTVENRAAFIDAATQAAHQFEHAPMLREQLISRAKGMASVSLVGQLLQEMKSGTSVDMGLVGTHAEFEAAAYLIAKHLGRSDLKASVADPARSATITGSEPQAESDRPMIEVPAESVHVDSLSSAPNREEPTAQPEATSLIQRARMAARVRA